MLRSIFFGLAAALVLASGHLIAEESAHSGAASDTAARREFKELHSQLKAVLDEIAMHQAKLTSSSIPMDEASRAQYFELVGKANSLSPKLEAAAVKAYEENPKDAEVSDLLFTMAINHLRHDNYERALELSKLLIANDYSQKDHAARIGGSAAVATMQLKEAKKMHEQIRASDDPTVQQLKQLIEGYEPLWKKEQELRDAEVKADDLPRVKLETSEGDIVVELFENEAPNTVANFISLVEKGFYDGTAFHRVLPGFMAQGGDPNTKAGTGEAGQGGPGYSIACECYRPDHRVHFRGSLSMAHRGRDTGGSQFFIMFGPAGHLDGQHTVFGRVIEGMDVLAELQRIDPEKPGREPPDKILKAEVIRKRDHEYKPLTFGGN